MQSVKPTKYIFNNSITFVYLQQRVNLDDDTDDPNVLCCWADDDVYLTKW